MRPEILFPLFAPATSLPGIGTRLAKTLEKLAGGRVLDLLWHLPTGIVDRRRLASLAEAQPGQVATVAVTVGARHKPASRHRPWRVDCWDRTASLQLVFFHAREDWLAKLLPAGEQRLVSGRLERYGGELQMAHPDHVLAPGEALPEIEPVYPLTEGLAPKVLRRALAAALERLPQLPEWQDRAWLQQRRWPAWGQALAAAHAPAGEAETDPASPARQRLAFDELLAGQLALAIARASRKRASARPVVGTGALRRAVAAALPFRATPSQRQAAKEILADMAGGERMLRLLQGDVGSGKTVVALMAMLAAVEDGRQAALLAPTELLARQHSATLAGLAEAAGIRIALLTGRDRGRARASRLAALAAGEVQIAVGTHALLQEDVAFADLALAVVDEQHRFGVHQRLALSTKGAGAHVLVMTATPIPRTLQMTAYGDLDVSLLREKPPGRTPVATRALPLERLPEVVRAIGRAVARGERAFWLCPTIDEADGDGGDSGAASARHRALKAAFGERVGLIHGRMKAAEKDEAMARFQDGSVDILVATTVVEVGVDVPQATVMVIEHAERLGLAQLHQLRGRVGRGARPSSCLLLYARPLNETARARLAMLRGSDDGFAIAEEDLRLRGPGELLGTRQSGLPRLRLADLVHQPQLLVAARDDARLILSRDPGLRGARGQALRLLLYLFERDAAVSLLRSG